MWTALAITFAILAAVSIGRRQSALRSVARLLFTKRDAASSWPLPLDTGSNTDYLQRVQEAATGIPMLGGNEICLLHDGPETYRALLQAIRAAKAHINIEVYMILDGEVARQFSDLLIQKAQQGVEVNLLYDALGSLELKKSYVETLRAAGISVRAFQASLDLRFWRFNQRDHRKLAIIDGQIGFIGGVNWADDYLADKSAFAPKQSPGDAGMRDVHTQLRGPVVAQLQTVFLRNWLNTGARTSAASGYFPDLGNHGPCKAAIVSSDRLDVESRIIDVLTAAVHAARTRIWIAQAYFVPHEELIWALVAAADRGVQVRIIVPNCGDNFLAEHATKAHFNVLLEHNIEVFLFEHRMMHAKYAVIDGLWATIGSSNLDIRSLEHNSEANVAVLNAEFASAVETSFNEDLKQCTAVYKEEWATRPWRFLLFEKFSMLFKYWL